MTCMPYSSETTTFWTEAAMYAKAYVEITNLCNKNCSFCHGHHRAPRQMSEAEFARVLEQLAPHTQFVYYHLMGEPLTHPKLPKLLQMAGERGFRSILTTNGTLLARRQQELLACPIHKVSISVHSVEQGSEAQWKAYLDGICDFADQASKQGTIVVFRLWNRGFDQGSNEHVLAYLRARFSGEWAENTRGLRIRHKLHLEWGDRFAWPDMDAARTEAPLTCYGLSDHFGILCDGTVVPCCMDSEGILALGNVFSEELTNILSSPRALAMVEGFRKKAPSEELCRRCGYAERFS